VQAQQQVDGMARRWVAAVVSAALVLTMGTLAVVTAPAASAAVGTLTLQGAEGTALAGQDARVALVAGHAGSTQDVAYNVTFTATLPPGAAYVAGTTEPAGHGDPRVTTVTPAPADPRTTYQVLVWENVSDLVAGGEVPLSFAVDPDESRFPVGSSLAVTAAVHGSPDERSVPRPVVDTAGTAPVVTVPGTGVTFASTGATTSVRITPLELIKDEESPETEILRGVEDQATVWTLTVRTAQTAGTRGVVVTDHLPGAVQLLGCESVPGCRAPSGTTTVVDPPGLPGVWTRVVWDLGDVPSGTTRTIRYRAAVGTHELVADGSSTGASTRQTGAGTAVTNHAAVAGTYLGPVARPTDGAVDVRARHTVEVRDISLVRSTTAPTFVRGGTARSSLLVRLGQYTHAGSVRVTDVLPDGMCPVLEPGTTVSGDRWPEECPDLERADAPGAVMTSVVHAAGTFTVTFQLDGMAANGTTTVTYDAYMRTHRHDGTPTATGDTFVATARVTAATVPVVQTPGQVPVAVEDDSSSTLTAGTPVLAKSVWSNPGRRPIPGAAACDALAGTTWTTTGRPVVHLGDLMCFRVELTAAPGVALRDAVLRDFVPVGTEFVDAAVVVNTSGAPVDQIRDGGTATPAWRLGEGAGSGRFLPAGSRVVIDVVARVTDVSPSGKDVLGNLAKLRAQDAAGHAIAARAQADFEVAPAAPLGLDKNVARAAAAPAGSADVRENDVVTYSVAVTHRGTAASGTDYALDSVEVADALPAGFTCGMVIPEDGDDAFECADATSVRLGDAPANRSVITWDLAGAELGGDLLLTPGETLTRTYDLRIPSPLSVSSTHDNTATVQRYTARTTDGRDGAASTPYLPAGALAGHASPNAPAASDTVTVRLPAATVTKTLVETSVVETANTATQATVGETAVFRYTATLPAGASVFSGRLVDEPPASLVVVDATASVPVGAPLVTGTCASTTAQFCLNRTAGLLRFPTVWTNATADAQTVSVDVTVRVADTSSTMTHDTTLTNRMRLYSRPTASGTEVQRGTATASVQLVLPAPTVTKMPFRGSTGADPMTVGAGETVTFHLTASNGAGRPPAHDTVVTDCLPVGLTLSPTFVLPAGLTATPGPVTGCEAARTLLRWEAGSVMGGASATVSYDVVVDPAAASRTSFVNTAVLTSSTLENGANDASGTRERVFSVTDAATLDVPTPVGSKTRDRATAVPGEKITWTLRATLPANANFYDLTVLDTVPSGLSPAAADVTATCTEGSTTWTCDPTLSTVAGAGGVTHAAWLFGDVLASPTERTVTLTFTSTVAPRGRLTAGNGVVNTADLGWFSTPAARTVEPTTSFERTVQLGTATLSVREPRVTVATAVSDTTVEQTQVVTYTVTATAETATPAGVTAYDVRVVDTVPAGVVPLADDDKQPAEAGDVVGGGTWDGRTITWTHDTVVPGNPAVRTYDARLAPAADLTSEPLENKVVAAGWASLDVAAPGVTPRTYSESPAARVAVTPQFPRVGVQKTQVSANPVYVGDRVTFRVLLASISGGTAATLGARDVLPAGWEYVAGSSSVRTPTSPDTPVADPTVDGQTLTWAQVGGPARNLTYGQTVEVTYGARPTAAAASAAGSAVAHTNTAVAVDVTDLAGGTSYNNGAGSYIGVAGTATARLHAADLRIAKTHSTWVAGAGADPSTWTVTVRNDGPDPAVGVSVTDAIDALPDGVEVVSVAGDGWACTPRDGDLQTGATCTRSAALASGASAAFTVTVTVAADVAAGTTARNTATVTARTHDPDGTDNAASDTATVTTVADVEAGKGGPATVAAGDAVQWTLMATNRGPSVSRATTADPIVLTDTLPEGVEVVDVMTATGTTCDPVEDGVLTCRRTTDLAVGETVLVTVTGRLDPGLVAADGPLVNTVDLTPVTSQGANARPDGATASTAIGHEEDLVVTKELVGDVVPGQDATYRITVRNDGPSLARGVVVTDDLPAGLTFAGGVSPADWTCTGTTSVTCALDGDLGVGAAAAAAFTFDVDVPSSVTGDIVNAAVVGSTWLADQGEDSVTSGPRVRADLGITKTHDGTVLRAGEGTTFRIAVTNHGPSDAPGPITVTDDVPAGLSIADDVTADAGTCEVGPALPSGAQPVTCTLPDGLDAGDTWAVAVPVAVAADAPDAAYTNTARVAGPADLDEGADAQPNTATDTLEVVRRADVTVTKAAGATSVVAGTGVTYTLDVRNAGPSVAAATVVRDDLPAALAPVSATWAGGADACTITGQSVECDLGDLAPGVDPGGITVVATVRSAVPAGTSVVNTATVTTATTDVDGAGPSTADADATITTTAQAELSLTMTPATQQVAAGRDATSTLVVTNDGPSDVSGPVTLTHTLPAGTSLVAVSTPTGATPWVCDPPAGQVVTCTLGDGTAGLVAGASAPALELVTRVAPTVDAGTLTHTAVASSALTGDSAPATADVVVTTVADLGVAASHSGTPVAGRPFGWTVDVRDAGPSDSRADAEHPLVVVGTLPGGATFAPGPDGTVTGDGFTCRADGTGGAGTVRCERLATLPAGAGATFELPVTLGSDVDGDLTLAVVVTPGLTPQPDAPAEALLPDTATDTVQVTGVADLGLVKSLVTAPEQVVAGRALQWRVDVTNHGPSTSRADADHPLVVVDTLPAGVQDVTASGPGWDCTVDGATLTCERPADLPVGAAPVITVDAVVAPGTTDEVRNVATVTPGSTPQADAGSTTPAQPDTGDVAVTPATLADLRLDKSVPAEPVAGATGTYRLRVTNLGPSDAVDLVVHDALPAGLTATGVSTASDGAVWECTGTATVACALDGPLPAAAMVWVDVEVRADQALTGDVTNTAHVTSGTPDPDPSNDGSSVTTGTGTLAALTLDKSHTGSPRIGDPLTFDLVVGSTGPSQARGVVVEDLVPASLQVSGVRSDDPAWVCATGEPGPDGTPVLCVRDELDAGTTAAPVHVDVVVTAAAYPGVTNRATVTSATPSADDPTGAHAADEDELEVPAQSALHLTKTLDGGVLQAGGAATYLLTVANEGPTRDPGPVVVTDVLPEGLRPASTDGAPCTAEGQAVTCTLDGLDVGEQATVRVHVLVDRDAPAEVTNTATVLGAAEDVAPDGAGTASATAQVRAVPLAVTGVETAVLALLVALLLAGGAGALVVGRRGPVGRHGGSRTEV